MKFAVVEYKYVTGKTHIVPLKCVKKYNQKSVQTDTFLCYISPNISDEPDFDVNYSKGAFNGSPGIFKVFVLKVTDNIEDAIIHQREKRLKSVPKKFRDPANTEAEISAEQKRKRRSNLKIQNTNKRAAMVKNVSYLSEALFGVPNANDKHHDSSVSLDEESTIQDSLIGENRYGIEGEVCPIDEKGYTEDQPDASEIERRPDDAAEDSCDENFDDLSSEPIPKVSSVDIIGEEQHTTINLCKVPSPSGLPRNQNSKKSATKQQHAVDKDTYDDANSTSYIELAAIDQSNNIGQTEREIFIHNWGAPYQILSVANDTSAQSILTNGPPQIADVAKNALDESQTLNYDQLVRELGENMYVIPAAQHFSGMVEILNSPGTVQPNENWQLPDHSTSLTTGNSVQSIRHGPGFPQEAKKYEDLVLEVISLRKENVGLSERNNALQDALVSTSKTVPAVPFESKNGGRLYDGSIFINETQCKILDKTEDPQKYLNNLALAIFGSKTLKNSSVTGAVSNNYKKPAKPMLDAQRLNLVYSLMAAKTNCHCFNLSKINQILNKKMYNLNATGKSRKKD